MKILRLRDLKEILDSFDRIQGKGNKTVFDHAFDYLSNSPNPYIEKIRKIYRDALTKNGGRLDAWLTGEHFILYHDLIFDRKLRARNQAYRAIFANGGHSADMNQFLKYLHSYGSAWKRTFYKPDTADLVYHVTSNKDGKHTDQVWDAFYRLSKRKVKLTALEVAHILRNRESAMGISVCFEAFHGSTQHSNLTKRFIRHSTVSCINPVGLKNHLAKEEKYNADHFFGPHLKQYEPVLGFVGAVQRISNSSGKQLTVEDLSCMMKNLRSCNQYAHAVSMLYSLNPPFTKETQDRLMPMLVEKPQRSLDLVTIARHVLTIERETGEDACIQARQLEELTDKELGFLRSMLDDLPQALLTTENILSVFNNIGNGYHLSGITPYIAKLADTEEQQQACFNTIMDNADYAAQYERLGMLVDCFTMGKEKLMPLFEYPAYANELIYGLMCINHAYSQIDQRDLDLQYDGDLQSRARLQCEHLMNAYEQMIEEPENAYDIAQEACKQIQISSKYSTYIPVARMRSSSEQLSSLSHSPLMFSMVGGDVTKVKRDDPELETLFKLQ